MSLPPGTSLAKTALGFAGLMVYSRGYWRGMVEGLCLGAIAGSITTACALALAWSHMGG